VLRRIGVWEIPCSYCLNRSTVHKAKIEDLEKCSTRFLVLECSEPFRASYPLIRTNLPLPLPSVPRMVTELTCTENPSCILTSRNKTMFNGHAEAREWWSDKVLSSSGAASTRWRPSRWVLAGVPIPARQHAPVKQPPGLPDLSPKEQTGPPYFSFRSFNLKYQARPIHPNNPDRPCLQTNSWMTAVPPPICVPTSCARS
jgi:hypothetical protein